MKLIREIRQIFPTCAYCNAHECLTLEHLVAISMGGTNARNNLTTACFTCNSSKQAKPWRTWYRSAPCYEPTRFRRLVQWEKGEMYLETGPCP
jgi:hypothetical protein